ncbi:MAG: hypothetical protein HN618_01550, partial [Flavobacteriales bacterium]|nr:hypothetical protein [Flavobacteriales bacterium]
MKLIIISYSFPPKPGVGGRRWAKFAKWFQRKGHIVTVLTSRSLEAGSAWSADIEGFKNKVIQVDCPPLPSILASVPKNLVEKVKYRVAMSLMKQKADGNYYDASIGWSTFLVPHIKKLNKEGYTHVVASGGPFNYLLGISEICSKLNMKFVSDFRDPWTNNETSFGYSELTLGRLEIEKEKEVSVIRNSDAVVSVAETMTGYFRCLQDEDKFHTIINGFDPDEIPTSIARTTEKIQLVFVGTLYTKTLRHVNAFRDALDQMENAEKLEVHFYGDMSEKARSILDSSPAIHIHGLVSIDQARNAIASADVTMLFLTDDLTYSFSTKFCEYVAASKPIWVISQAGITPDYVEEHQIGVHSLP